MRGSNFEPGEAESTHVTAYVRPTTLLEPIDSRLATLHTLAKDDVIDGLSVELWPGKVSLSGETVYSEALDAFDRFDQWADENGVSIRPPFVVQSTTSELRGETHRILRTPVMCLALTVDGDLAGVFPHTDGETEYVTTEAIAALKADALLVERSGVATGAKLPADETTCPQCDGRLVVVQGVALCHDCAWHNWENVTGERDDRLARRLRLEPTLES